MTNGINQLIAQGRPAPQWDWMEAKKNVLALSQAEREYAGYPEERNWLREQRGMLRTKFGQGQTQFGQEQEELPFKREGEALDFLSKWGRFVNYRNYPDTRMRLIKRGVNPEILPPIESFGGDENKFNAWLDKSLTTLEQKIKEREVGVKERAVGVEEEKLEQLETKGQSDIGKIAIDIYGKPYRQLNPEEKKDIDERVKGKKTEKTPPSAGNVVDLAIKRKFGTEYLSDPEKVKEGDKWLASEEGRKAVKQARDDLTTPSITYLQTGEGFVPAITKGEGIGTIGKPTGLGKPIPAEETAKMGGLQALLNDVSTARELYKPGWVGPISGRVGAVQEKYTGGAGTNQVKFYAYIRDMKDALLRARSGAQINEQEYKRLVNFLPDENLPPKTFKARLDRFEAELNNVLSSKKKAFSEGGYGKRETKPEIQKTDSLGIR